jgi:hypothetical protein
MARVDPPMWRWLDSIEASLAPIGRQALAALRRPLLPILAFQVLPPGASTMRLAVPAYWPRESPEWGKLQSAGQTLSFVVVEQSWPATAENNSAWKQLAQDHLAAFRAATGADVLGYVSTRSGGTAFEGQDRILGIDPQPTKADSVKKWYDQFGGQITGIYFDELVLPEDPASVQEAHDLVAAFHQHFAGSVAVLAGQCNDESVLADTNIRWALMWEGHFYDEENGVVRWPYPELFAPLLPNGNRTAIPAWWRNPAYRDKIVHVVHNCAEPQRQHALGLAKERNAGHVFVMERRGLTNPSDPNSDNFYDKLPTYWQREILEVNSYYDFGLDPLRALKAAHRYAVTNGKLHGWPNFEQAWYPSGHVRGTYLLGYGTHGLRQEISLAALTDPITGAAPQLYDIPAMFRAANSYAKTQSGCETALPTFEQLPGGTTALILLKAGQSWLAHTTAAAAQTYEKPAPTFAEPGAVIRNANRIITQTPGINASFVTFVPDGDSITGRKNVYDCYAFSTAGAPVTWRDVPTEDYIAQL